MPPEITVKLDTRTAALFEEFCRLEQQINTLIKAGVFDIRDGKATIYLDRNGVVVNIRGDIELYNSRDRLSTP
jgi:hypothetical protein